MSGNQESRIRLPTWRCSDIPIKKRKYLLQPQLPATTEEAGLTLSTNFPHSNEKGDSSVGRSVFNSSGADENQNMTGGSRKIFGELIPSFPSVSVGNADKAKSTGNTNLDQTRVKVEKQTPPIQSRPLTGFEIPSSSSILSSSLYCSLGKLPLGAEHPDVALTSDDTRMKVEQTVPKTHDIFREPCDKKILRGNCLTEATSGAGSVSLPLGCKTKNNSPDWEIEGSTALNLSLSKGVCAPICTKSDNHDSVNRSNWDLNTTMDAWEDDLERKTRVTGSFVNSNSSLHEIETSSCCDSTVFAKSVSEKQKENVGFRSPKVTLMQFDSLGLSSYQPIEKSPPLPVTTSEASAACTSVSRPTMTAGNVNSVNLRTVKSEDIGENVSQEAVCPVEQPIKGVKHEVLGKFNLKNNPSSGIVKPAVPISVKAEPSNFTRSEVVNRRDGTLDHPHTPILQSNVAFDLPTTSTPNQKDIDIPCSNGINNAPLSLNEMKIDAVVQTYPECRIKEYSGQSSSAGNEKLCEVPKHGGVNMTYSSHGDHNLDALGVKGTFLTEDKSLDDCKTCISKELPRNSRGTSISDEENINLSGKGLEEELHSYGVELDCGHDPSTIIKKQGGKLNLYDDGRVQGPAAVITKGNEVALAECGGYETERQNMDTSFHGDFQNPNQIEEKGSQPAFSGSTGDEEGQIFPDGEEGQIVPDGEGMSGVSTVSGGNVENPEIVDNSSPVSYRAGISTVDNEPLDASGSFVPLRMERDRLPDFPLGPRKFLLRESDESCKFSRERCHGKFMRSPRLNFMPDRRRLPDNTESNLHDRDTKNFEFDNHGNTRRGGAFMSNFQRGRRAANDEVTPYSHSFPRRAPTFSYTHRGPTIKENASASHGVRDGEKFTRGLQSNKPEPMFMNPLRPYQGRNNYSARGRTKFSNNPKRGFPGFRSQSPVRSREQSDGPSSSFRNRAQEEFSSTDFSHRRSPSGYRMKRMNSPDQSGYSREMVVRRHNSPPFSHRTSNPGRGWGYSRGRGYGRGGNFRKSSDRVVHRNHGNLNNLDPRERVEYGNDFLEGPLHSKQFGVDVNAERRRFGYRHDATSSFRRSFNNGGCAPTNVENDPDAVRFRQDSDMEIEEQRNLMEIDGKNKNSTDNVSGRTNNMEEEEMSKHSKIGQRDEVCGEGV